MLWLTGVLTETATARCCLLDVTSTNYSLFALLVPFEAFFLKDGKQLPKQ